MCGVWVCGVEVIFGIDPNLRVFPNILHMDRQTTGFTMTGFEPGRRVLLEIWVFDIFAPNLDRGIGPLLVGDERLQKSK